MKINDFYDLIGEDYSEVESRLFNGKFVKKFVLKFIDDLTFENLEKALNEENLEKAFQESHTLKGICLNLGFSQLFKSVNELTELLRPLKEENFQEAKYVFEQVKKDYYNIIQAIKKLDQD